MARHSSARVSRRSILGATSIGIAASGTAACSRASSPGSGGEGSATAEGDSLISANASASAPGQPEVPTLDELVAEVQGKFAQETYSDPDTGKELTFNVFLPEGYSGSGSYPLLHYIADASTVSDDPTTPLSQYGALIWASSVTQAANPCIVVAPSYTETVLDDHDGYTTTDWLDIAARFVAWLQSQYAIDSTRVYGTGQSMGRMIHLVLAGKQPDLFTALMFVDGQWDPTQLSGLGESTFIYHVAGGDEPALEGQTATEDMLTQAGVDFAVADEEWDATADPSVLLQQAEALFSKEKPRNFSTFVAGTVMTANPTPQSMEHMASFEPAYKLTGLRNWLLSQRGA
ncbi:alpha/beta hydrolase-fold protein [Actinomyces israelii]|uniref:Acyl-CoA:diacylglycerol acyltransferase n=1 Tax=Actinomyces israelii TaxID=1659 RepID=A0ABT4I680_9ACTO|nr:alpha/beta hydrolase-fold protein [Actinomyces israelii]MCZ0857248.1 alpha/beta hydrolase-fold protein [Actinomyces israelii]